MVPLTIFCDACILYPAPIRDLLMECALNDLIQLKWSHRVLNEWIDNLIRNRPDLNRERLEKTKEDMINAVLDSIVENYEEKEKELELPDENDRHVLAAAIASKSKLIVTANLKDFPQEYLSLFHIKSCHPDDLFLSLSKRNEHDFITSVKVCYQKLRNPPQPFDQYIVNLKDKCKLPKTVEFINQNKLSF